MDELISRKALIEWYKPYLYNDQAVKPEDLLFDLKAFPAVDAVAIEKYNDLAEDFIDYVCSGSPNPAPYCANACEKCVDRLGWCANGSDECKGFRPKGYGERKENKTD